MPIFQTGSGAGASGTVSLPTLAFASAVAQAEGSGGTTTFTFTLTLTRNGVTAAIPYGWTVTGAGANPASAGDFAGGVLPSGTGTFAPAETSKSIVVSVAADSAVEPDEGFTLTASASLPLASATASGTILNDDSAPPRNFASPVFFPGFDAVPYGTSAQPLGDTTNTTHNGWAAHVNRSGGSIAALDFVYAGSYAQPQNGGAPYGSGLFASEADAPNAYTVTCAIEYPIGSPPQQLSFAGGTAGLVNPGALLATLQLTLATPIPDGAVFRSRTYATVSAGQRLLYTKAASTPGNGRDSYAESGVGLPDKTLTGTIAGSTSAGLQPCLIRAYGVTKPVVAVLGDSLAAGHDEQGLFAHNSEDGAIGGIARGATGLVPVLQSAVPGSNLYGSAQAGKFARRLAWLVAGGASHALCEWSINDLTQGLSFTATDVIAGINGLSGTIAGAGIKPVWTTMTPYATSTSGFYLTSSMATNGANMASGATSERGKVNAAIRAKTGSLFDYVELGGGVMEAANDDGRFADYSSGNAAFPAVPLCTVTGSATTTTIPSTYGSGSANALTSGGAIVFTSGVLAGVYAPVSANTNGANSVITLATALAQAPAAGDQFRAFVNTARLVGADGLHWNETGHRAVKAAVAAKIAGW